MSSYPVQVRILDHETGYTDYPLAVVVENQAPSAWFLGEVTLSNGAPVIISGSDPSPADWDAGLTYYISFDGVAFSKAASTTFVLPDYGPGLSYDISVYAVDKDGATGRTYTETFYTDITDTVIEVDGSHAASVEIRWGGGAAMTLGNGIHYFDGTQGGLSVTLLTTGAAYSIRTNSDITGINAADGVTSVTLSVHTWAESHFSVNPFGSGNIGPIYLPAGNPTTGPSTVSVGTFTKFGGVTVVGAPSRGKSWAIADSLGFGELTGPIVGLDRINFLSAPDAWIGDLKTYEGIGVLQVYGIRGTVRTMHDDVCPPIGLTATIGAGGVAGPNAELIAGWLVGLTTPGDIRKLSVRKLDGTIRQTAAGGIEYLYVGEASPASRIVGSGGAIDKAVYGEKAQGNLSKIQYYDLRLALMLGAGKTLPQKFKETIKGAPIDWPVHHMIPQAMKTRLAKDNIDVDKFDNLRLIPLSIHSEINNLYDGWKRQQMIELKIDPNIKGNEAKFWKQVKLDKVLELTSLVDERYGKYMLNTGNNITTVRKSVAAAGEGAAQKFRRALKRGEGSRITSVLSKTGKVAPALAIFGIFSENVAMAKALATDPPEGQAAWQAFETQYNALLKKALAGGNISANEAHNFIKVFNDYLAAIKTPDDTRGKIIGFMSTYVYARGDIFVE